MKSSLRAAITIIGLVAAQGARAHEFWIDPEAHTLEALENIRAALRVGQDYKGSEFPYLENRFKSFTVTGPNGTRDVAGISGDRPAADVLPAVEGLHILAYHSTTDTLTFNTMEKFINYLSYEGNQWALEAHREAGMPESGFTEDYTRNAKSLVQVGAVLPAESDRALGLPLELIAGAHPATVGPGGTMPVQLLWRGAPLGGRQINIFTKGMHGDPPHVVTDMDGRADIPLRDDGRYMLSAVHMIQRDSDGPVHWESFWASLTFAVGPEGVQAR